jgi:hypothetical protein
VSFIVLTSRALYKATDILVLTLSRGNGLLVLQKPKPWPRDKANIGTVWQRIIEKTCEAVDNFKC